MSEKKKKKIKCFALKIKNLVEKSRRMRQNNNKTSEKRSIGMYRRQTRSPEGASECPAKFGGAGRRRSSQTSRASSARASVCGSAAHPLPTPVKLGGGGEAPARGGGGEGAMKGKPRSGATTHPEWRSRGGWSDGATEWHCLEWRPGPRAPKGA